MVHLVVLCWCAVLVVAQSDSLKDQGDAVEFGRQSNRKLWFSPRYYFGKARSMQHDGLERWFLEFKPPRFKANAALLVQLHWANGNMWSSKVIGRLIDKDPFLRAARTDGFLMLSPNGVSKQPNSTVLDTKGRNQQWNDILGTGPAATGVDDVGFISALVDWAIRERQVDPTRVYVTGISTGGLMTYRMLIERPGMFAAAAVFVANLPERNLTTKIVPTPIFIMNGFNDTVFPFAGGRARFGRGQVRSAEATRDYFVQINKAGPMVETLMPDLDPNDGCRITSQIYASPTAPVHFYRMDGGAHVPAGKEYRLAEKLVVDDALGQTCHDARGLDMAWKFMSQFKLQVNTSKL
jgi:polyhydroxybutyrate depolymerase